MLSDQRGSSGKIELSNRIFYTLMILVIYRLGTYIPLPGVNSVELHKLKEASTGGVLGMLNTFTGGALGRMSIFALNIMPYITSSIIIQLLTISIPRFVELKKDGSTGRKVLNQYTRYLTIVLALLQGYGMSAGLEKFNSADALLVQDPGYSFRLIATLNLAGGTLLVMWFAEQITANGFGNGSSVIIFTGIISSLPGAIATLFELGRTGSISTSLILLIVFLLFGLMVFIVYLEKAQRRVLVQYPRRQIGRKLYGGDSTHLPMKLNVSGVIPPIFASAILSFPLTIVNFSAGNVEVGSWQHSIMLYFSHGKPLYIILYVFLIISLSFFYSKIVFNPEETASMLKKNNGIVLGRRPGAETQEYFLYLLNRITVIGALCIAIVCIVPELLIAKYSLPFYIGGTGLLIVVNVVMDSLSQVQSYLLSSEYATLIKKGRFKV